MVTTKHRLRRLGKWVGLTWLVGFSAFMVHEFVQNSPRARSVQGQLEREFESVVPPPHAAAFDYESTHKTSQALVSSSYRTDLSYPEIRAHYDAVLAKQGWVFYEEERVRDWGRDLGGKTARYCKGEYRASVQYAGEKADYGWDYGFGVSWGLDSLADRYADKFRKAGCQ